MYQIIGFTPSLVNIQRCFFPSSIPSEHIGKYAFLTTACNNSYFIKICVNPLLRENLCVLDETVQCTPKHFLPVNRCFSYDKLKIVPSVKLIRTLHIELVFKTVWDLQKWLINTSSFNHLLKLMLESFALANNVELCLSNIHQINKIGIHFIVIKNIGNLQAGKVSENTKIIIDHETCFDRYILKRKPDSLCIPGLSDHFNSLKELLVSFEKCSSASCLLLSLKILVIGPDGCGKKSLVRAVAAECGAVLVIIDGPELSRPEPGETEHLLKKKFDEAALHSKEGLTILLLVRLESICGKEGRILSQFLHLLDSVPSRLAVIATTARPQLLHQSLASSARFHSKIFISIPSEEERSAMITTFSGGLLPEESAAELAKKTPGFVIADLNLLFTRAKRLVRQKYPLSELSFEKLLDAAKECLYQVEGSAVRGELGLVKADKLELSELGGLESVKTVLLQSVVWPLSHPTAFSRLNIRRSSGVLLYGPPGCAKTCLARAIATSSNLTFLSASAADLLSPYVGDAELTLTGLFQRARDASPTLLFIDEIDALVGSRGDKHRGVHDRLLSTFLIEMDGIGVKAESTSRNILETRVTVLGATNRPDCIDAALLRPGRLDRLVYVPPPSRAERLAILTILTKNMPLSDCVDLDFIAENTGLFSGADLQSLCQEAGLQALTSDGMDAKVICQKHWLAALREVPPSLSEKQIEFYTNFTFS